MKKKRYVIVGTGGRAVSYLQPMVTTYRGHCELVGLCDLSAARMRHYNDCLERDWGYRRVQSYPAKQ